MITKEEKQRVAAAARALRGMLDVSQVEMANRAGVSSQSIAALEHGELNNPRRLVLPVCNAAGVTLDEFSSLADLSERAAERMKIVAIGEG